MSSPFRSGYFSRSCVDIEDAMARSALSTRATNVRVGGKDAFA
jgi:hypothetical protein